MLLLLQLQEEPSLLVFRQQEEGCLPEFLVVFLEVGLTLVPPDYHLHLTADWDR